MGRVLPVEGILEGAAMNLEKLQLWFVCFVALVLVVAVINDWRS